MSALLQLIVANSEESFLRFMEDTFLEAKFLTARDRSEFDSRTQTLIRRIEEYFPNVDPLAAEPSFEVHEPQEVYALDLVVDPTQLKPQLVQYVLNLLEGTHVDFRVIVRVQDATKNSGAVACFSSKLIVDPRLWSHVNEDSAFFGCERPLIVEADSDGYRALNSGD